jgi:hypothetical protein
LELIDEAIASGRRYPAPNYVNRETRLHGASVRGPASRWSSTTKPEKSYMSAHRDTDTEAMVYVRLLHEGTDVWRPVRATALPDGTFRLLEPNGYDPNAETWEFPPSTKVRCVTRKFTDGGEGLVAVARG